MSLTPGSVFLADCPARFAVEVIANKWAVVTLFALSKGPLRHGELVELIGGVSRKVLTQTLRRLEQSGLVEHDGHLYRLTSLGHTLEEPIAQLTNWARTHGEAVVTAQEQATAS